MGLSTALHQAYRNRRFLIEILMIPWIIVLSQVDSLADLLNGKEEIFSETALIFFQKGMSGNALGFIFPVLCSLPYASSLVDEVKSGAVKSIMVRSTRRSYLWTKILACMFSGALVMLCGLFLAAGLSLLFLSPWGQEVQDGLSIIEQVKPMIPQVVLLSLSGALWAGVGMLASCLSGSRYVAYLSPFICYYLLIILYERYFESWVIIYPKAWLSPGGGIPFGFWGTMAWVLELIVIVIFAFVYFAGRKLRSL